MHFSGAKKGSAIMPKLVKLVGPSSTLAEELSPCFAKRGSAIMPELVKLVGPSLTLAEELSPCFARSAAVLCVRLRVFVPEFPFASLARSGC